MGSRVLLTTTHLPFNPIADKSQKFPQSYTPCSSPRFQILCSLSGSDLTLDLFLLTELRDYAVHDNAF